MEPPGATVIVRSFPGAERVDRSTENEDCGAESNAGFRQPTGVGATTISRPAGREMAGSVTLCRQALLVWICRASPPCVPFRLKVKVEDAPSMETPSKVTLRT